MHDLDGGEADQLVRLVAEQDPAGRRHVGADALRVGARDQIAGVLREQAEAPLRLGQRRDHRVVLGDVDERRQHAGDRVAAGVVAERAGVDPQPAQLAIVHVQADELVDHVAARLEGDAGGRLAGREGRAVGVHPAAAGHGRATDQLLACAAEDALGGVVHVDDRAAGIAHDHGLVHAVHHMAEAGFGRKGDTRLRSGEDGRRAHTVPIGRPAARHYPELPNVRAGALPSVGSS